MRWNLKVFLESGQPYSKITHTIILIFRSGAVRLGRRLRSVLQVRQGAQHSSTT
jgi:hypothetical protein